MEHLLFDAVNDEKEISSVCISFFFGICFLLGRYALNGM